MHYSHHVSRVEERVVSEMRECNKYFRINNRYNTFREGNLRLLCITVIHVSHVEERERVRYICMYLLNWRTWICWWIHGET
jgi:hypothetical protein